MLLEIGEEVCISDAAYKSIFYQDLWYQLETRETELLSEANRRWKGEVDPIGWTGKAIQ